MKFNRTHTLGEITESTGDVTVCGWIEDVRKMKNMAFLILHDSTGRAQIILKGEINNEMNSVNRQSVVRITGSVQQTRARDFTFEIVASEINILSHASARLPIDPTGRLESDIDNRLNSRALDMRNPRISALFKIRHYTLQSLRKTLSDNLFLEITTPKIIGSASEGGADLFDLKYFGKQAYLAQSPQLYKEQMTLGLERVFEIASFYRAEKSHTGRHLAEFTSVDVEAAFMDYTDVMNLLEKLITELYKDLSKSTIKLQEQIGVNITPPSVPFEKITYTQAVEELESSGQKIKFGDDLTDSQLRILGSNHTGFYFLTDWPLKLKPFYIREKKDDPTLSRSFDLQYGYLELSSGGTRLHDAKTIKSRLEEQQLNPKEFSKHLETFEWGMPPHSGWGMGLERLLMVLTKTDNLRELILYPRDADRLFP